MKKFIFFTSIIFFSFPSWADYIIVESYVSSTNEYIITTFPNYPKSYSSIEKCDADLIKTQLSKNNYRKAIVRNDDTYVVEYWNKGGIHTSISCSKLQ